MVVGPKRMAPSATPVGCEQLPVTEGSFSPDSTKAKAPDMPSVILLCGERLTCRATERSPQRKNGITMTNQIACPHGREEAFRDVHGVSRPDHAEGQQQRRCEDQGQALQRLGVSENS